MKKLSVSIPKINSHRSILQLAESNKNVRTSLSAGATSYDELCNLFLSMWLGVALPIRTIKNLIDIIRICHTDGGRHSSIARGNGRHVLTSSLWSRIKTNLSRESKYF